MSASFLNLNIKTRAALLVTLSAILYGFLGYFGVQLLEQQFSVSTLCFWRFFIATLWIVCATIPKIKKQTTLTINFSALVIAIIIGSFCYAGGSGFYFLASQLTGTGLAMIVFFAYPIFIVLFVWQLEKKHIPKKTIICLLAIIVGVILLAMGHEAILNLKGIFFGVLAAVCYAIYFYGSKNFSTIIPSYLQTIFICLGCTIIFLLFSIYAQSFAFPSTISAWMYVFAIGIIATALPIQLLLDGLKHIDPNKASILSAFEPIVTLFVGMLMLGETVSNIQFLGAMVIIVAAVCIH